MGKTINDFVIVQLDRAFDEKELDFIMQDLSLDKNDPASKQKHFKVQITKIGLLEKKELGEELFEKVHTEFWGWRFQSGISLGKFGEKCLLLFSYGRSMSGNNGHVFGIHIQLILNGTTSVKDNPTQ